MKAPSATEKALKQSADARAYARGMYDAIHGCSRFHHLYKPDTELKNMYDYGFHNGLIVLSQAGVQ